MNATSDQAPEFPKIDSILDFLYVDFDRIKSWLAQIVDDGVLVSHKKTENSGESSNSEISGNIESNANATLLFARAGFKGSASGKSGASESFGQTHEKSFDASWSMPSNFLDLVTAAGLIERNITEASIGSLILAKGTPALMDIKFLKDVWAPGAAILTNQTFGKITHSNKSAMAEHKQLMSTIGSVLNIIPPFPQLSLRDESGITVWATLKEEHMVVNASALALTHGVDIPGKWGVLAILDAHPDSDEENEELEKVETEPLFERELMAASGTLLSALRELIGRPKQSIGITPIIIYRIIGKGN